MRFMTKVHPGPDGGRSGSRSLKPTMPHGCSLKNITLQEWLIDEKDVSLGGIYKDDDDEGDVLENVCYRFSAEGHGSPQCALWILALHQVFCAAVALIAAKLLMSGGHVPLSPQWTTMRLNRST